MVAQTKVTPGRWVYALAGGFLLVGILGGALIVGGLVQGAGELEQMVAPGEATIRFDEPGAHGLFYESSSVFEGDTFTGPPSVPPLDVVVIDQSSGEEIVVRPPFGETFTYNFGDRSGELIGKFEIERPGDYTLRATGAEPEVVLAAGPYSFGGFFASVGGIILCAFLAFVGAVLLIVFFFVRRSNRKRMTSPPPQWVQPGPPPPSYPGRP